MISHTLSATRNGRTLLRTIAAVLSLLGAGISTSIDALAYDLNTIPTPEIPPQIAEQNPCAAYGRGFVLVGDGFCSKAWGSVTGYATKEFTDTDIMMVGQRITTPASPGAGVPIAYYFLDNVNDKTRLPGFGGIASADLMIKRETGLGSFTGFVRVVADGGSTFDEQGNLAVGLRNQSYYLDSIDEAWIQFNGLKIGVQPSMFGFNRLPSTVTPGYTSIITTAAISYTYGLSPNASLSVAAEDGGRRTFGDGVLARPERSDIPDAVALLRFRTPTTLFHLSAAVHESEDEVVRDFARGSPKEVTGWAWSAGIQSRIIWANILGEKASGVYGRFGLTVANAEGALGYLGIPLFSPDYVVMSDGDVRLSSGWSAVASYEHMLATNLKLSTNFSYFRVHMNSSPEALIEANDDLPATDLNFSVGVQGAVYQLGLEWIPLPNLILGIEGAYTWTWAEGHYADVHGGKIDVGFPQIGVYATRLF